MATTGPDSAVVREAAVEGIITPDAVVLELETAGVASRVCAGMIDAAVQFAILFVGAVIVAVAFGSKDGTDSARTTASIVLVTIVLLGYPVVSETFSRGRTVGKAAVGLRAVTIEGGPITFRHAMLRMMGGLVDRYVPPGGVAGMLFVLGTRRRQRIGDLLAGTVVIRDPQRSQLPPALWFPVPFGFESYAGTIDPSAMTVEQYTVIRAFLVRVKELTPDARFSVADALAGSLARALRHERPPSVHPETFLLCAIARYQRRTFPHYQPVAWQPR